MALHRSESSPLSHQVRLERLSISLIFLISHSKSDMKINLDCRFKRERERQSNRCMKRRSIEDFIHRSSSPEAKPLDSGVSGIKRKSEATITECVEDAPSHGLSKKLRQEWTCSLCQVPATCEQGLKDHFRGRKHKAKERAKAETTKPVNKNADNSEALVEESEYSKELGMNDVDAVDSGVKLKGELKNANDGAEVSENEITTGSNVDCTFWCNTCKFGTNTEEEMTAHRVEKRHMTLWQESGGGVTAKKTMPDEMQYVCKTNGAAAEGKEESD